MFVTPAYAQAAGGAGAMDIFTSLMPILLLVVIFWLLIFRPQQKRMKAHPRQGGPLHGRRRPVEIAAGQ